MPITLKTQSAFSLVEVLVALLIISVGMLAFAASEIMGQRGTHSALKRSLATTLANDLAERIHANPSGDYKTTAPMDNNTSCSNQNVTICSATQDGSQTTRCTKDQMAAFDLLEWFCGRASNAGGNNGTNFNSSFRGGVLTLLGGPNGELPVSATVTCTDPDETDQLTCTSGLPYNISLHWQERGPDRGANGDPNRSQQVTNQAHDNIVNKQVDIVVVP